jgi:pSer/pThr/pTyr-binding forkhead associated (FHA) protein
VPPVVLTTLKILFLALLYLFIARAIRIIYLDMVGVRATRSATKQSSKRAWGSPKQLAVTEPGSGTRMIPLEPETTIGKDGATVPLADTYASTRHARIWRSEDGWMIEDLGSTNGTIVNKAKVLAPQPLKVGDEIRIGKTTIEVRR